MAGLAEEQGTKRKRVFRACDSCRAMKSKVCVLYLCLLYRCRRTEYSVYKRIRGTGFCTTTRAGLAYPCYAIAR